MLTTLPDVFSLLSSFGRQVAKDVSIRLHNELDSVEKKRGRLEQENEEMRVRLQDLEVAKQVLQAEMEKQREVRHGVLAGWEGWDWSELG